MTLTKIAQQFDPAAQMIGPWGQTGNINRDCHHVRLGDGEGILQRLNTEVFPNAEVLMDNAVRWSQSQPVSIEFLRAGGSYWVCEGDRFWRMMRKIEGGIGFFQLEDTPDPLNYAQELGKALARAHHFAESLAAAPIGVSLPGFRDPHLYWRQYQVVLESGISERLTEMREAIDYLNSRRAALVVIRDQMLLNRVRRTVIHGDTKIENFLFDKHGKVIAMVDLDTVMTGSWLMDWGDMMRSLTNPAGEKAQPDAVKFGAEVYERAKQGYLAGSHAPPSEIALMEASALATTLEQALRFLFDYLRGDSYYRLGPNDPPALNRTRAEVQIELARQMERAFSFG